MISAETLIPRSLIQGIPYVRWAPMKLRDKVRARARYERVPCAGFSVIVCSRGMASLPARYVLLA